MFTNKKREGINRFVCDVSFYVAETPKASTKDHEPLLPIIPFGIVAYGFLGQPLTAQPRSQSLSSLSAFVFQRPREAEKRDPGNKVVKFLTEAAEVQDIVKILLKRVSN